MNETTNSVKRFPTRAVFGGVVAMFLAFGVGRFAYTPLLTLMQEQSGLSLDLAGYLASMMYLGYLTSSVVVTKTLSRFGALTLLRCGLIMLVLGTWAMNLRGLSPAQSGRQFYSISAYFLHGFAYTIGGTFMVAMLTDFPGFQGQAHSGWILVGAMVIPSCIVWPLVAARAGEVKTTVFLLTLLALANIIIILWQTPAGILVAAAVFGSSFLAIPGLVLSRLGKLAGSKKDEVTGFATVIFGIAMVLGPSLGGLIAKLTGSFDWSLAMVSAALLIASVIATLADQATKTRETTAQGGY